MLNRKERRADFFRQLPRALEKLVAACRVLPKVEPDGSSACTFARTLYIKKTECVLEVQEEKEKREQAIERVQERIEEARNKSPVPWWANEDCRDASHHSFGAYCRDLWANEKAIEEKVCELNEEIDGIRVEIEVIDEFLAKAAEKVYPGDLRDEFGRAPGEKSTFNMNACRDEEVQRFLQG